MPRSTSVKLFLALNKAISLNAGCSHFPENAGPNGDTLLAATLPAAKETLPGLSADCTFLDDRDPSSLGDDADNLEDGVARGERLKGDEDTDGGREEGSFVIEIMPAFDPLRR